ncbi:MAG: hypothetical protein ABUL77_01345 [Bacteroidota bacterium]
MTRHTRKMLDRMVCKVLWSAAALTLVAGCSVDFPPFNRLTSLRVLAIQSEPAAPAPGETATLSALVSVPPTDSNLRYTWKWCPFVGQSENGYRCLLTLPKNVADLLGLETTTEVTDTTFPVLLNGLADLANVPHPPSPPSLNLGAAPTADLLHGLEPALVAAICQILPAVNCATGLPVQIMLTVRTDSEALGTDEVISVVTGHLRFPDPLTGALQAANANPEIDGLSATIADMAQPITDMPAVVTLPRDKETQLELTVAGGADAAETYDGMDDIGAPATGLRERMYVTWFVETGDTEDSRTSFIPDRTPFDDMRKNKWTPARVKDYRDETARIFVVLHDNRGGVGWRGGVVQLEPTP